MFLIIHESGDAIRARSLDPGDLAAADAGVCVIFDISDTSGPTRYSAGKWLAVEEYWGPKKNPWLRRGSAAKP